MSSTEYWESVIYSHLMAAIVGAAVAVGVMLHYAEKKEPKPLYPALRPRELLSCAPQDVREYMNLCASRVRMEAVQ